jgi:peroxiredoxin
MMTNTNQHPYHRLNFCKKKEKIVSTSRPYPNPIPDALMFKLSKQGEPERVSLSTYTKNKNVVIFGVPGAFTPLCSQTHVPDFVQHLSALKALGFDHVICVAVNDPFVMDAWQRNLGAQELIFLSDAQGAWLEEMDLLFDGTPFGLGWRSKRFCLKAQNGHLTSMSIEPSPTQCAISSVHHLLKQLTTS